ncbi:MULTISPECIES: hypothetical protein [Nocardia]|uniref:hypothetical protein n=1 Tax=Nocardia TaxID=1817 RepID=UPI0002FF332E|nr:MULTISPECIES: hypothetical protein [Nocardia]
MPDPNVEVVVVRDPSAQTWVSVYVDGVVADCRSVVIDAGHGWEWDDWRDFRDATLAEASSPACRAELIDAFDDPPGGEYVLGRDRRHWLDGVEAEDRLASRYRLTGPRAVAVTVPPDTDIDAFALTYLREHLPEGQRLLRSDRTPAADTVAAWATTSWDTVLTAAIADTTGEVTAHQLLYRLARSGGSGDRVRVELAHRHEIEGSDYYRGLDPALLTALTPATRSRARIWRCLVQRSAAAPPTDTGTTRKDTSPR